MHITPITGVFGAEITGMDCAAPIGSDLAQALRAALARHLVIVLRDQRLDPDQHRALTRVFGEPAVNPYAPGPPEHPEMTSIIKEADERTGVFGGGWHTDLSFLEQPPGGSVLAAVEIPPYGGDTPSAPSKPRGTACLSRCRRFWKGARQPMSANPMASNGLRRSKNRQ